MIVDQKQFSLFASMLPELERDEVFFLSLSTRNKYLSAGEREEFSLGRTEMFSRMIAYDKDGLSYAMEKLRSSLQHRRTRNGKEIPEKSLVCYANVNPSSMLRAYTTFKKEMDEEFLQLFQAQQRGMSPAYTKFLRMEKRIMNAVQKAKGRRELVDIDFDVPDAELPREFASFLACNNVDFYSIQTQGGYHILLKKSSMGQANQIIFPKIQEMHQIAKKSRGEVCFNKNGMIPIPGTMQAGKLVSFVDLLEEER